MKPRSRIYFGSSLLLLIIATVVSWQFRFVEAETAYWRDRPLEELTTWRQPEGSIPPAIIKTGDNVNALKFSLQENRPAVSTKTWPATGEEMIKVRLHHRSINSGNVSPKQNSRLPLVTINGINEKHHHIFENIGFIISGSNSENWQTSEAVLALHEDSHHFAFRIVVPGEETSLCISDLDIVEVREASWFRAFTGLLWTLWAIWIFQAIRSHQSQGLVSLITSLWILSWGGYLIFPRTIDIPRPFLSTFSIETKNTQENDSVVVDTPASQKKPAKIGPKPKVEHPPTKKARKWFKSFGGGRFLMHFGVMGVFIGGLVLLLPLRNAWPYILTMIIGVELVPAVIGSNADFKDLIDILAYLLAFALAIPIANRVRSSFPKIWGGIIKY